jgi:hypothetical protein
MTRRLIKELRSLPLPWCVAAAAMGFLLLPLLLWAVPDPAAPDDFKSFCIVGGEVAFFVSIVAVAALSFGAEFQQRTLPLFLSQPISRARLWREKSLSLGMAIIVVLAAHWITLFMFRMSGVRFGYGESLYSLSAALTAAAFILATVCSSAFWTLVTRSSIGGLVFNIGSQCLVVIGITSSLEKWLPAFASDESLVAAVLLGASLIYSPAMLWLGWRKFAHLELRDSAFGESVATPTISFGFGGKLTWLRCRPVGRLSNLVRKELRLQKPAFLIGGVFSVCSLLTCGLSFLQPSRAATYEVIFDVMTAACVPLLLLLPGCIAMSEEKSLGLAAWHLTLPVSIRLQWLVKFVIATAIAITMAIVLPVLLAGINSGEEGAGLLRVVRDSHDDAMPLIATAGTIFVMSFWAAALLGNVVRAVLATIVALPVIGYLISLGFKYGEWLGGLEGGLLVWIGLGFELSPAAFDHLLKLAFTALYAFAALAALAQSLLQFRRAQTGGFIMVKYSAILAGIVFLVAAWAGDLSRSTFGLSAQEEKGLKSEFENAIYALPAEVLPTAVGRVKNLDYDTLERTGKLSELARAWFQGESIRLVSAAETKRYQAVLRMGQSRYYSFEFTLPPTQPAAK